MYLTDTLGYHSVLFNFRSFIKDPLGASESFLPGAHPNVLGAFRGPGARVSLVWGPQVGAGPEQV